MIEKEEILFQKMQEGDWHAFNSFFECYVEQLCHYAFGIVKKREVAEDIVQDVFIYLWVNRAKITWMGSVYAYLCRSVKNSCIDYKLHEEVERRYQQEIAARALDTDDEEDNFEELYDRLQMLMSTMPEKCREIFILGCIEGMSYKEIADQLGISVNTVKTQMKVAYRKLKDEYKDGKGNVMLMILCLPF